MAVGAVAVLLPYAKGKGLKPGICRTANKNGYGYVS